MQESQFLERIWEKYKEENTYSEGIAFADTLDIVSWIGRELEKYWLDKEVAYELEEYQSIQ